MAQTPAAVQAALGSTLMNARITAASEYSIFDTTHQQWYVVGNCDAPGKERWCTTLSSDSAATQAAAILAALQG